MCVCAIAQVAIVQSNTYPEVLLLQFLGSQKKFFFKSCKCFFLLFLLFFRLISLDSSIEMKHGPAIVAQMQGIEW